MRETDGVGYLWVNRRGPGQEWHMAQHAEASGSLVLARRPWTTARSLSQIVLPRPVQPAEIAQARVFEELLRTERAELQDLAHRITTATDHSPGADNSNPSRDLAPIRAGIEEISGLLEALRRRFLHSPSDHEA